MPFGSLFRASQWPTLEKSLTTYYDPPPHPSQTLPPDPPEYPCRRPHREYLTRGWSTKLYDPIIAGQREILLDLYFKKGDAVIDAFKDHCQFVNWNDKKDGMGYLERAAVDAKAVRDWVEFQRKWVEADEKRRAEEELRRQQQQQQQQDHQQHEAAQQHQQRPPRTEEETYDEISRNQEDPNATLASTKTRTQAQQSVSTTTSHSPESSAFPGAAEFARNLLAKTPATKVEAQDAETKVTPSNAVHDSTATSKANYVPPKVEDGKDKTQSMPKSKSAKKQGKAASRKTASVKKTAKKITGPFIEEDSDEELEDEDF